VLASETSAANNLEECWNLVYAKQALILQAWGRLEEAFELLKKQEALCLELANARKDPRTMGSSSTRKRSRAMARLLDP
jgi:hypothetical protein